MSKPDNNTALRDKILKDCLIHETHCAYSLYEDSCDCVQFNVATTIVALFQEHSTARVVEELNGIYKDHETRDIGVALARRIHELESNTEEAVLGMQVKVDPKLKDNQIRFDHPNGRSEGFELNTEEESSLTKEADHE